MCKTNVWMSKKYLSTKMWLPWEQTGLTEYTRNQVLITELDDKIQANKTKTPTYVSLILIYITILNN